MDDSELAGDPESTDSNDEGGSFNEEEEDFNEKGLGGLSSEEEVAEDGDLVRRGEDIDDVMDMERQQASEEVEMPGLWDDFGSVRNAEDSVPITQEEPSIIDSVSPND